MRIRVYRNLNNGKLSLLHKTLGKVIGYAESVRLTDVKFVVLPGGKRRTIATGQRNVHAFVEGVVIGAKNFEFRNGISRILIPDWFERPGAVVTLRYSPFSELGFVDLLGQEHTYADEAEVYCSGNIFSISRPRGD